MTLARLGIAAAVIADVATMIRATERHEVPANAPVDAEAFLDADLAILGADSEVYDAYVANVRAEYPHVTDDDWRTGRGRVLRSFSDRPTLFFTLVGRSRSEAPARANLARELTTLC